MPPHLDPIQNPFSPGAGAPPPELVGRDPLLSQARILLARTLQKRPEKSFLVTGLRGVGKTVLLNEIERRAQEVGFRTISVEAHEAKALPLLLAPHLRRVLFDLDRMAGVNEKVKRALAVLKSFATAVRINLGPVEIGLDIDAHRGVADSGDLEVDLPDLLEAIGVAAQERGTGLAILVDEVQYLRGNELSALIMAMHRMQQRQLPVVLMGAGLPTLPALAGDSKSYSERLFSFPHLGPLSRADAAKAIRDPMAAVGVDIEEGALAEIFRLTQGYPYFIQEWAYVAWNRAPTSPITVRHVEDATGDVISRLDESFFKVRFDRLTPREKEALRCMAGLGAGPHATGDVAEALGMKVTSIGPLRAGLLKKGMIYSPSHGQMAFTVPLFDEFILRAMP